MQLQQNNPSKLKRVVAYAVLSCLCSVSAYSAWAATPVSGVATPIQTGQDADKSEVGSYSVAMDIKVAGIKSSPRVIVRQGTQARVAIQSEDGQAKWDFSFTLTPAPAEQYKNAVTIDMVVKKGDEVIAKPKLITGLGQQAKLQKETPDKQLDFDIAMTASLAK